MTIHGRLGVHAQDLINRGIISDPETRNENLVIVSISATRRKIEDLLEHDGIPPSNIINLSGVMMTSPNAISSLHFLFGKNVNANLRVAVAGNMTPLVRNILDRAFLQGGIVSFETTRIEHDKKMAIIQGLAHLLPILIREQHNPDIEEQLIKPWLTPVGTITDMIFENPFTEEFIIQFFESIKKNGNNPMKTFLQIVDNNLNPRDLEQFSTPNVTRILNFHSDENVIVDDNMITRMRSGMNNMGKIFVRKKIEEMDTVSHKKRS